MLPKPSILLVDDETAITDNLAPFLVRSGFAVTVASNGEAALEQVAADKPDLLVLDVLMPRLDGRAVLRQLHQAGNWTPIILLALVGEASERAMALEEGADDLPRGLPHHRAVRRREHESGHRRGMRRQVARGISIPRELGWFLSSRVPIQGGSKTGLLTRGKTTRLMGGFEPIPPYT